MQILLRQHLTLHTVGDLRHAWCPHCMASTLTVADFELRSPTGSTIAVFTVRQCERCQCWDRIDR